MTLKFSARLACAGFLLLASFAQAQITDRLNGVATGLAIKAPTQAVAIAAITLSGEQTVNGTPVEEGDRVLVTAQASSVDNGIYVVDTSAWERAADFDGNRDVVNGTLVTVVSDGGFNVFYQVQGTDPIVIGESEIDFVLVNDPNISYELTAAEVSAGLDANDIIDGYVPLDVRRYGGNPADGTANSDQVALDAAVDVAEVSGGTVYLPEGTWNGCITVESPRPNIVGAGMFATILEATDCDGITLDYTAGVGGMTIRDLNVQGVTASTRTGIKLAAGSLDYLDEIYGVTIERVLIRNFNVGIHSRTTRNLSILNNWIQDVDKGIEFIGKNLLVFVAFNKLTHAAGAGGSGSTGVTINSLNYTTSGGVQPPEGLQFVSNQVYGFDTAFDIDFVNFMNIVASDIAANIYGIDFATAQLGLTVSDTYFDMVGASVAAGIYGRGLASPISAKVNLLRNTLNATTAPASAVAIQINDSGNQNQNYLQIDGNYTTGDWDAGDILINNAGPTWITNNRLTSPTPANSISVPSVVTGPVIIRDNLATKGVNYDATEARNGELVIGPNIISAAATPSPFPGKWTTPSFSAGNFTANGSMTWTVESGDVATYEYEIVGNKMTVIYGLDTTTVGGTPNTALRIAIPASKTATKEAYAPVLIVNNAGTRSIGTAHVAASGTVINIQLIGAGNFTAETNLTYVKGQITFEIN